MIMKELMDILSNFLYNNFKILLIFLIIFILVLGFMISRTDKFNTLLFYPDNDRDTLLVEKRSIVKGISRSEMINNTIGELLLGSVDPDIKGIFPNESKLLSVRMEGKTVLLNFNKETINGIREVEEDSDVSVYYLSLESIVDTVCFLYRDIENVRFFFDGKEYRYIGDFGPIDNGLKPDWNILKR